MYQIMKMSKSIYFKHAGFDALVFRLYLDSCFYICLASIPYTICLLPIYGTSKHDLDLDLMSLLSITTVMDKDSRLWAAVIGCYLFTLLALYYLSKAYLQISYATDKFFVASIDVDAIDNISWFNYKSIGKKVIDFNLSNVSSPLHKLQSLMDKSVQPKTLLNVNPSLDDSDINIYDDNGDESKELLSSDAYEKTVSNRIESAEIPPIDRYTVMIRDLPDKFRNETHLKEFMNLLFPDKIAHAIVVRNVSKLNSIKTTIKRHKQKLEKYNTRASDGEIFGRTKCCGCCGDKINVVEFHQNRYDLYCKKFKELQKGGLNTTPTGFVIFTDLETASMSISCPIRFGFSTLKIERAPYPTDLLWANLTYSTGSLTTNNFCVGLLMLLLMFFWSIPVALIQGLANLDHIFAFFGGNVDHYFSEGTQAYLQGTLTVLILDLWLSLLPLVAAAFTAIQHETSRGKAEVLIMQKYYWCLIVMVLLVTVLSSMSLVGMKDLLQEGVNEILQTFAQGLSQMSTYFLLYVLLNTFIWLPLELYRPSYFLMKLFKHPEANRFVYSTWFAKTMLILVILLTYGVMNPIMWILGLIYFAFAKFVFTYHLSMSYVPMFETGARLWPTVYESVTYGLYISVLTLMGLFALKHTLDCTLALIPLIYIIYAIKKKVKKKLKIMFKQASLTTAQTKDAKMRKMNVRSVLEDEMGVRKSYLPPIMKEESDDILDESVDIGVDNYPDDDL